MLRLRSSDQLDDAVSHAVGRLAGVPWMWWVGPDSAPDTAARLADHGAVKLVAVPVMTVHTDKIAPVGGPADLKIETVEGIDALTEWAQAYTHSFGVAPELLNDVVRNEAGRPDSARIVRFVGRRDGRVVGTSLMFDAYGVAGIYVVTTSPDCRRQGIGTALTTAALEAGRERGLSVGTLQASPSGAPVYRRMGFEPVAEYELFKIPAP